MQMWNSFLQTVFQFVKSLFVNVSKKMYRNAAVLSTGMAVVTVVSFTAGDFGGGGRNALVAFAEMPSETDGSESDLEEIPTAALAAAESIPDETEIKYAAQSKSNNDEEENIAETKPEPGPGAGLISQSKTEPGTDGAEGSGKEQLEDQADVGSAGSGSKEIKESESAADETEPEAEETAVSGTAISISDKDYRVLLRIVQAEAGICDTKGRILVANVILNRVKSSEFPNTVTGVVYERSQFSPVLDGSINTCKVTQKTIDAVDRALAGEDYSKGALYFMNRKTSSRKNVRWFDSHLKYLFKHGSHEFFK